LEKLISRHIQKSFTSKDIESIKKSIENRIAFRKNLKKEELKLEAATSEKDLQKKLPTKLLDAINKDRLKTELFIVE